jgi:hypothetical protein
MCTVTFIAKGNDDFILTSNRDEIPERNTLGPQEYKEGNVKLIYPKDVLAGGTWIGVSEKSRLINLLNGGFEAHQRKASYRMSRGVVVKQLLVAENVIQEIKDFDFKDVEPFTIVLVDWSLGLKLFELVWDEQTKHFRELDLSNFIWSSSPLYSNEMKAKRQKWFSDFVQKNKLSAAQLFHFHHTAGEGNKMTDFIMDRGFIKTVSITQVEKSGDRVKVIYKDLKKEKEIEIENKPSS